jgi:hypothetical protein
MVARLLTTGLLLVIASPAFAEGFISMSNTPYPDSVVIIVTVEDPADHPECGWLAVTRGTDVGYIQRHPGTTFTARVVDTNVEPNTLYCYTMALRAAPTPVPCVTMDLCGLFYCFYMIQTCANTGPDPAFIGRGFLKTTFPGGGEVDYNEVNAVLWICDRSPDSWISLHSIPADAGPYVDSGTPVDVFGSYLCCWAQGMWLLVAEVVIPHTCIIAVEPTTWGSVKAVYRD